LKSLALKLMRAFQIGFGLRQFGCGTAFPQVGNRSQLLQLREQILQIALRLKWCAWYLNLRRMNLSFFTQSPFSTPITRPSRPLAVS
jgi:hypothetical protein